MSLPDDQSVVRIPEETGIHICTFYEGEVVPASQDANEMPVLTL